MNRNLASSAMSLTALTTKRILACTIPIVLFNSVPAFAQLNCANPRGTAENEACFQRDVTAAETRMAQAYQKLVARLGPRQKQQLKNSQTAWENFREANCKFLYLRTGGSIAGSEYLACKLQMTQERTRFIDSFSRFTPQ